MAYQGVNALTPFWEYDKNKPVIPRGLRGYRKYKNGLLNVTPIEGEIELVEQNSRESPLLCLPPEIRAMIWDFTIGGNIIRPSLEKTDLDKTTSYIHPPEHRFSLLRVSRQVYFEAAILVWKLSTFRFHDSIELRTWLESATTKARKMTHKVELGVHRLTKRHNAMYDHAELPNVKVFDIRVCGFLTEEDDVRMLREALDSVTADLEAQKSVKTSVVTLPPKTCWVDIYRKGITDYL